MDAHERAGTNAIIKGELRMLKLYRRRLLFLSVSVATITGCGSNIQQANHANFTAALNAYYEEHPECIRLPKTENDKGFDYIAEIADDTKALGAKRNKSDLKPYLELSELGIFTAEKTQLERKFFSQSNMVPAMGFKLTKEAKALLYESKSRSEQFMGPGLNICYGHRQVVRIENFTEPAEAIGVTASQVQYAYKIVDVADWAKNLKVGSAFARVTTMLADEGSDQDDMILTDNGWMHHRAFK